MRQKIDYPIEFIAGIKDPEIFALMPIFEEGIGADRISDMAISILYCDFLKYTERMCTEIGIKTQKIKYHSLYEVPLYKGKIITFIPSSFLSDLPLARDYDDIDIVCNYNDLLRKKICAIIGLTWKEFQKLHKPELKGWMLKNINRLNDIIRNYKNLKGEPYDFKGIDAKCENADIEIEEKLVNYPLNLLKYKTLKTLQDVIQLVHVICNQYKSLIENNRMYQLIYDNNDKIREEKYAQLLFYTVACSYCDANDIDLSRESNCGIGALDFKLSQGNHAKIAIEIKYSSNPKLNSGYMKQLPAYVMGEQAQYGILLILWNRTQDKNKIDNISKIAVEKRSTNNKIIIVNAIQQLSASKR